jgi:hypothetical protein
MIRCQIKAGSNRGGVEKRVVEQFQKQVPENGHSFAMDYSIGSIQGLH